MTAHVANPARHRRAVLVGLPLAVAVLAVAAPPTAWQIAALAPLVAVLGLPHGALDLELASALWPLERGRGQAIFASVYLGLTAAVIGLWSLAPGLGLGLFLAYSAVHFSDDWRGELAPPVRLLAGAAVVSAPALAHLDEVGRLFAVLAPGPAAQVLAVVLQGTGVVAVVLLILAGATARRPPRGPALEIALLVMAALLLPPLVYFLLYFCGVHSPRHFLGAASALGLRPARAMRAAAPIAAVTLVGGLGAVVAMRGAGLGADAVVLRSVFTGLAALTVPHMVLVDRFWRWSNGASGAAGADAGQSPG